MFKDVPPAMAAHTAFPFYKPIFPRKQPLPWTNASNELRPKSWTQWNSL